MIVPSLFSEYKKHVTIPGSQSSIRTYVKFAIAAAFCAVLLVFYQRNFAAAPAHFDFGGAFYIAARMLHLGLRHQLFDVTMQRQLQLHYLHATGALFYSPAIVAVLYWPTAFLSATGAYLFWSILNMAILLACARYLGDLLGDKHRSLSLFIMMFLFLPVHLQFLQGQVDLLLLLILLVALSAMVRQKDFLAGFVLALGLIKFQIVIPLALILILRRKWRTVGGFAVGGFLFASACAVVTGVHSALSYPRLLLRVSTQASAGVNPWMMPNLRGLFFRIAHHDLLPIILWSTAMVLLIFAARYWRSTSQGFAVAIVASMLTSYHMNPHSLVLMLIPLIVLMKVAGWTSQRSVAGGFCLLSVIMIPALLLHTFASMATLLMVLGGALCWISRDGITCVSDGNLSKESVSASKPL